MMRTSRSVEIECPKCHTTIRTHVVDGEATTSEKTLSESADAFSGLVECPNCGETFQLGPIENNQASIATVTLDPASHRRVFSHFELIRILGRGGFGTVWLAADTRLHRHIALKLPTRRQGRVESLLREARTAAKLRHPNIVAVHEVGEFEGQAYIVSDYVEGTDLHTFLRQGVPPIEQTVTLLQAIASGLQHAHDNLIVHRDIKPANVLVSHDGTPLVTDFGLAKKTDVDESISSKGKIVGTFIYMSPEQAGYGTTEVSYQSDIYSLGVMMYEMLTGERPFRGDLPAIIDQKVNGEAAPLRNLRPSIPLDLETVCLKCLELNPERRYQSANAFRDELERYRTGRPILARPSSKLHHAWRWCLRNPLVATLLTLLFTSLVAGLTGTTLFWQEAVAQNNAVRRSLYNSKLQLAGNYFQTGEIDSVRDALESLDDSQFEEFASFESRYLSSQIERFQNVVQHGQQVRSVAVSRDGDWFASVSNDNRLMIWSPDSKIPIREVQASVGRWLSVDVSRRDNRVACGSKDGSVYTWKAIHDRANQPQIAKHGVSVSKVKFSGDGHRLFTAGTKGAIRVWDAETLALIRELPSGQSGVVSFDVSRDGHVIAVAGNEGTVRVWDVDNREMICSLDTEYRLESIALSPDASRIVLGTYTGYLLAYESPTKRQLFEINTDYDLVSSIEFMANTPIVSLCSSNGTVVIFDTESQHELSKFDTHFFAGGTIDVTQNGGSMVVGAIDGTVKLLRTDDFRHATVIGGGDSVTDLSVINDSTILVAYRSGRVTLHDLLDTESILIHQSSSALPVAIAVSRVKRWIAYQSSTSAIEISDMRGETIASIPLDATGALLMRASNQDGNLITLDARGKLDVFSIDPAREPIVSIELSESVSPGGEARLLCVSDDASRVAIVNDKNELHVFEIASHVTSVIPKSFDAPIACLAFAERDLVIGTADGYLRRIAITTSDTAGTSHPIWEIKAHIGSVAQLRVLKDLRAIVSVGRDSRLCSWDSIDGSVRMRVSQDKVRLTAIDILPDNSCIVTGANDGMVRLWNCPAK